MILSVTVPCYCSECNAEKQTGHKLVVSEFAGKTVIEVQDAEQDNPIVLNVEFDDLVRAWNAVKR